MRKVKQITPFVLIPDLDEAIAFYEGLGFACTFRGTGPGYAFLRADGGAIRLLETDDPDAAAAARQHMVYIDMGDIDAFWDDARPFLDTLPRTRVRAPFDQSYGQREVHVIDPGGTLLLFGQEIG
ncbi:VOC family protein [Jannaschia sp. S6380]|uniref:VOC family protein n=1 Tax=Jannaschia sp. S6380 TaxID=2926408 RepID=UPI001FF677AE|nr:VOC family protein [Jannaschia sp. S6380]MCK0167296.1 VOC family protein [Jannaschia sp. S6380]